MTMPTAAGAASAAPVVGLSLTSLAAVKRACVVGAHLNMIRAEYIKGGRGSHLEAAVKAAPRRIERAQGNAIAVRGVHRNGGKTWDPDTLGWLYWPKASEITPHGDDTFTVDFGGFTATYRVIP